MQEQEVYEHMRRMSVHFTFVENGNYGTRSRYMPSIYTKNQGKRTYRNEICFVHFNFDLSVYQHVYESEPMRREYVQEDAWTNETFDTTCSTVSIYSYIYIYRSIQVCT